MTATNNKQERADELFKELSPLERVAADLFYLFALGRNTASDEFGFYLVHLYQTHQEANPELADLQWQLAQEERSRADD